MVEKSINVDGIQILIKFPDGCDSCPLFLGEVAAARRSLFVNEKSGEGLVSGECEILKGSLNDVKISLRGAINGKVFSFNETMNGNMLADGICIRESNKPKKAARS
jgi:hypothetical protein